MSYSVIIPTYSRPECIARNLEALLKQQPRPIEVVIIDASADEYTKQVVEAFHNSQGSEAFRLVYLRNPEGRGNTPNSRNRGVKACSAEIVAFLDDDAFPHVGWADAMLKTYLELPDVMGVAGRALNGLPGEEVRGLDLIGKFLPDGTLTGNFAADPGNIVDVDHAIGCNMSLRKSAIEQLGGFRDDLKPGPFGICEETEIFIRGKKRGMRFVFNPAMLADHIAAPQPGGRRFTPKYSYYHARNNVVMIIRIYGFGRLALRHLISVGTSSLLAFIRKVLGASAHFFAALLGLLVGIVHGVRLRLQNESSPK